MLHKYSSQIFSKYYFVLPDSPETEGEQDKAGGVGQHPSQDKHQRQGQEDKEASSTQHLEVKDKDRAIETRQAPETGTAGQRGLLYTQHLEVNDKDRPRETGQVPETGTAGQTGLFYTQHLEVKDKVRARETGH